MDDENIRRLAKIVEKMEKMNNKSVVLDYEFLSLLSDEINAISNSHNNLSEYIKNKLENDTTNISESTHKTGRTLHGGNFR